MQQPFYICKRDEKKGGKYFYYKLRGEKTFHSTHKTDKGEAVDFVLEEIKRTKGNVTPGSFGEYIQPFFTEKCPRLSRMANLGKTVTERYRRETRKLIEDFILEDSISKMKLSQIRRRDILDFQNRLVKKGYKGRLNNRILSALKIVFKEAEYNEDIGYNPAQGVELLKYIQEEKGIFTPTELKTLFKECPGVWEDIQVFNMFLLAASTGMRKSEILALTWEQIDFVNQVIRVDRAWKDEKTDEIGLPKWNKTRFVPIPIKTAEALKNLKALTLPGETLCFQWDNNQRKDKKKRVKNTRLGGTYWQNTFKRGMKNAEIKYKERNLTPHSFRHTLNSILLGSGYTPDRVRSVLGWSDEKIQADYTHQVQEQLGDFSKAVNELL